MLEPAEQTGHRRTSKWPLSWLQRGNPQWLWWLSGAQFLVLVLWMVLDPRFDAATRRLQFASGQLTDAEGAIGDGVRLRAIALVALLALVTLTLAWMFLTLFLGSRKHRELRAWFAFVTLLCLWIGTANGWQGVTWWGKQWRMRPQVVEFEAVAQQLRAHWPRDDGELASNDPFMAYPVGNPSTLIMLTLPKTTRAGTSFSVVDRGKSGALRFQLTGRESGDWLEWHPANEQPASFVGGLMDAHELVQYWNLGDGWFLVRYRQ